MYDILLYTSVALMYYILLTIKTTFIHDESLHSFIFLFFIPRSILLLTLEVIVDILYHPNVLTALTLGQNLLFETKQFSVCHTK